MLSGLALGCQQKKKAARSTVNKVTRHKVIIIIIMIIAIAAAIAAAIYMFNLKQHRPLSMKPPADRFFPLLYYRSKLLIDQ